MTEGNHEPLAVVGVVPRREVSLSTIGDEDVKKFLQDVSKFQYIIRQTFKEGRHYGTIPGTPKPSLWKPGAEAIFGILRLRPAYSITHRVEDMATGYLCYEVKCQGRHIGTETIMAEGDGECNSFETKYRYRFVGEKQIPPGMDKASLPMKWLRGKNGSYPAYQIANPDPFSIKNTLMKMAEKRALVGAAITAAALSDLFTQDMEDLRDNGVLGDEPEAPDTSPPETPEVPKEGPPEKKAAPPKATAPATPPADAPSSDGPSGSQLHWAYTYWRQLMGKEESEETQEAYEGYLKLTLGTAKPTKDQMSKLIGELKGHLAKKKK